MYVHDAEVDHGDGAHDAEEDADAERAAHDALLAVHGLVHGQVAAPHRVVVGLFLVERAQHDSIDKSRAQGLSLTRRIGRRSGLSDRILTAASA